MDRGGISPKNRHFSANRRLVLKIKRLLFIKTSLVIFEKNLLLKGDEPLIWANPGFMHIYSGASSASGAACFCNPYGCRWCFSWPPSFRQAHWLCLR